ncbi:glycoside hydrolase family 31 protein [Portibacter lacus]|uniref:Alpha-glucosidase n=1 Tax=Portibacter lacus TaxID=1099794 RepID=A0AA37SU47_9BACT|nr:TIM-barrel domain-containing protein [Portibacter lacus]GLR18110.1 alpha-glucosidase [Portibacter lacus]
MIDISEEGLMNVVYGPQEKHPGEMVSFNETDQVITCSADNECHLRIELLTSKIVRFRYTVKPYFPHDFSYAIDPKFKKEHVNYECNVDEQRVIIKTDYLEIHILKHKMFVHIYDAEGNLISSDEKGFHWEENHEYGGENVKMSKSIFPEQAFYGLGDKTTLQNIKGNRFTNWGSDEFGFKAGTDPLYKNINFLYSYYKGKTFGLYFDNSFRTFYDIGQERKDILSFWANGGEMDYYFFYGDDLLDVSAQYTQLTGVPEMPPLWALGYQQCKWSYFPESNVMEITERMRAEKIPCDAIYLDIDYMDGFRCFTWNKERFPDPKQMVSNLKTNGFKTVAIIDPGIKIDFDYSVFKEGLAKGYFCRRMDGPYMQGKVWPGECYFPDFTNPEAREWWAGLFQELIEDIGLAGIWNDMNEPALFDVPSKTFPLDVRHHYEGHPSSHRKAHNVYGMQMARATSEGVKKFAGNKRPLIITRSGFSGMQRFSSTWTGDNLASWEHLYLAHLQTLRLSISGVSFCGSDIGGFIDQPEGELYVRWIQLGVFHPFFRTHSSGDHGSQEPWSFGSKNTAIVRKAIELRYKLLPYLYTCFYEHTITGRPMLRPVIFNSTDDADVNINEEGFLGEHLLFSPVFQKNIRSKKIYLPKGKWYDYESTEVFEGGKMFIVRAPLTKIPFFIRAGAVIPTFPKMQYVGEKVIKTVTLKTYFAEGETTSGFYMDDLDGYQYQEGAYRYSRFITKGSGSTFVLGQSFNKGYEPSFHNYRIQFIGLSSEIQNIHIDGVESKEYRRVHDNKVELIVKNSFTEIIIQF